MEQIRKFLKQPCLTYYNEIDDKRTAIDLLRLYPDSVDKLYLLYQIGEKNVLSKLFYYIMKSDSILFYRVIRDVKLSSRALEKLARYAIQFGRKEKLDYLIRMGVRNYSELALISLDNSNPELTQHLLNLSFNELNINDSSGYDN